MSVAIPPEEGSQLHWYIHTGYLRTPEIKLIERDTSHFTYSLTKARFVSDLYGHECCWVMVF